MYEDQPTSAKSGPKLGLGNAMKTPLREANGRQTRDPESQGKGITDDMDISQRESSRSLLGPRYLQQSIESLCYKLDLGSEMPERLPRIDYSSRRGNSEDMAVQTAQIFRGVQLDARGTVVKENARATRSNAGKALRRAKRSRQAANIHQARGLVDVAVKEDNVSRVCLHFSNPQCPFSLTIVLVVLIGI